MGMLMSHEEILQALEHAPGPGPTAPGLAGFVARDGRYYCVKCFSRLSMRGFICSLGQYAKAIWNETGPECLACR